MHLIGWKNILATHIPRKDLLLRYVCAYILPFINTKTVNIIENLEHFLKDYIQEAKKCENILLLLPGKYTLKY